ncbi:Protein VTS1 [Leucoagaricus sp. SymC.cos]|nr:Protein VTS1 [Leucoagaricus sp. SymC.cos]
MSLRQPSVSPSPSPGPSDSGKVSARQSMGPSARGTPTLVPGSPRPGAQSNARPTSELLGSAGMFQTPEAEALDQWFENLQNYEATLEDMAAASLDVNFKEELGAIEQWFKVLSEAERTAALYSLLQHSTQVQIRFFITVLQQMARADPMTALLSPAMGSMQSQMEASLARMKSPGLKSNMPASPTTRNFGPNRQSLVLDNNTNYLSPDSAANNTPGGGGGQSDAAATLAQQRAKLKASGNAIAAHPHRISAPVLATGGTDIRASWGAASSLAQVVESSGGAQEIIINRPKSSDFSGTLPSPHLGGVGGDGNESWASLVNTPAVPLFPKNNTQSLDSASAKLNEWNKNAAGGAPGVPVMGDPTIHRRKPVNDKSTGNDDSVNQHQHQHQSQHNDQRGRNASGPGVGMRNTSGGWGNRGQAPGSNSSNPNPNNNDPNNAINGLGMQLGGLQLGMGSPGMGMPVPALAGMPPMSPFNLNMLSAMGLSPEAQLLAAQMAASGYGHPGWMGMQAMSAGVNNNNNNSRRGPPSSRSPGTRSATSLGPGTGGSNVTGGSVKGSEEDFDPAILNDIPAWLRSLRLHKYTPNFEGMRWQDVVLLDEQQLENIGVAALGARRKMLKTFEIVRRKMGMEGGQSAGTGTGVGQQQQGVQNAGVQHGNGTANGGAVVNGLNSATG